jgi:hypothetical protein
MELTKSEEDLMLLAAAAPVGQASEGRHPSSTSLAAATCAVGMRSKGGNHVADTFLFMLAVSVGFYWRIWLWGTTRAERRSLRRLFVKLILAFQTLIKNNQRLRGLPVDP